MLSRFLKPSFAIELNFAVVHKVLAGGLVHMIYLLGLACMLRVYAMFAVLWAVYVAELVCVMCHELHCMLVIEN